MFKNRKKGLLVAAVVTFMCLTLAGSGTIAYAVFGFKSVKAEANVVTVSNPSGEKLISISDDGQNFGQTVTSALNAELESGQDQYAEAGVTYVRNESDQITGLKPSVILNSGTGDEVKVIVSKEHENGNGIKLYEGTLSGFDSLETLTEFEINPGETSRLVFSFMPNEDVLNGSSATVDFDLKFEVIE
jgi:hypothetical protein